MHSVLKAIKSLFEFDNREDCICCEKPIETNALRITIDDMGRHIHPECEKRWKNA